MIYTVMREKFEEIRKKAPVVSIHDIIKSRFGHTVFVFLCCLCNKAGNVFIGTTHHEKIVKKGETNLTTPKSDTNKPT